MTKEEIKIPAMGESISEATIGSFIKAHGEQVKEGEEIVELETEKVNQVLYAPHSGLLSWQVKEGDRVKIGQVIGYVEEVKEGGVPPPAPEKVEKKEAPEAHKEVLPPQPHPQPQVGEGQRIMVPEFVEELKREKGPQPPKLPENRRKLSNIRKTIARRLVEALHSSAMLTTFNEADMSAIMGLRAKYQEAFTQKQGVKLGLMSFFVTAVVEALKAFPDLNSYIDQDEIVTHTSCDIGVAVSTDRGLVVPVIRSCEKKSLAVIEKEIATLAQKARSGKLAISDVEGGGFTITNGGVYGSLLSTPILNPPQTGILGMHKIMKRPVVVEDEIVIRPMMYLALSYDHRLIDGKEAVSFLIHIKEILEDPTRLILFDDL